MKKFLLGALGIIAMAAPAVAADLPARTYTKAPPPPPAPIYDWTGFYIGGNGGWGESHNCWNVVEAAGVLFNDGCLNKSGGLIGGQVGYRWQMGPAVFGLEAQGDWANISEHSYQPFRSDRLALHQSRRPGPLHGSDRLYLGSGAALRKGRRGGNQRPGWLEQQHHGGQPRDGKLDPLGRHDRRRV